MRQGSPNGRRPRGRHHNGSGTQGAGPTGGGNPMGGNRPRSAASLRHQTFDSNGPDVRVRGNAWQVFEKYQSLARDASGAGDRVAAENYLQHAEHYYRIIEAINEATAFEQRQRGGPAQPFGSQPDMPTNYYAPDGSLVGGAPVQAPAPEGEDKGQAVVEEINRAKPAASPFFSQDEVDEHMGAAPMPLAAQG